MPLTSTSLSYVTKHAHQLSFLFLRKAPFVRVADARSPHRTQLPKGHDPFSSRIIHSHSHPSVAMVSTNAFLSPSFTLLPNRASDPIFLPPSYPLTPSSSLRFTFHHDRHPVSRNMNILYASAYDFNAIGSASLNSSEDLDKVPMPVVLIDQDSDAGATIVQIGFGDRLGALIDTMKALKDLGLAVSKGTVSTEGSVKQTKFFITQLDTGRKVEDPDMLERIRLTIIGNLLKYHPESSALLAMGEVFGIKAPEKKLDIDIATNIQVKEDGPKRSLLCIETADRPGLLVEIISVIADINIDVESAEIDTEGLVAKDKFHVSYGGAALNNSMSQVLVNCLRYYLRRPETDIDSY